MFPSYVPAALAALPQWIFWQSEVTTDGRLTKVPYQAGNWIRQAASTRPEEWDTLEVAYTNYHISDRTGVGFVFAHGGGIFGIDIDDISKVAPEDQEASLRLRALIHEHFPTYCEVSPSGTGRHYLGYGSLPEDVRSIKDSKYGIEVYDKERFFTFTGNVINDQRELIDCQASLSDLAHTMRGSASAAGSAVVHETSDEQRSVEDIIREIRGWSNGTEFSFIMDNPLTSVLARYKNDHSSADFALSNFVATATKDQQKAVEIFRRSPLYRAEGKGGYKPEAKYIVDYLIGFCFAKVWGENVVKEEHQRVAAIEGKQIAQQINVQAEEDEKAGGTGYAAKYGIDLPLLDATRTDCPIPPGMAGQFIKAIHDGCYNPLPEFAIAVGMAFMSGLCGRAYTFQGQGVNAFFMVGAKSSTGKTQSIKSLQRLLAGLNEPKLGERLYAVSGKTVQGMHTNFEKAPAGAWITDECGSQVKALTEPSGQSDHELKDAINSLFDAAAPGTSWRPPSSRTSQKEDRSITALSVGIGWFTTREKIYSALNDNEVADGFLSRFVPMFYDGVMGDDNYNPITKFPDNVARTLKTLWKVVSENDVHMPVDGIANQSKMVTVDIQSGAADALRYFSKEARNITRRAQNDNDDLPDAFIAMARVGVTAQRLAAVCAVLDNPIQPVITIAHVEWAVQLVGSRMLHVLELMSTGEVGSGDNVAFPVVVSAVKTFLKKYPNGVPKAKLHERLRHRQPFINAKYMAPHTMVKKTIADMLDDRLITLEARESGTPGRPPEFYLPTNDPIWK